MKKEVKIALIAILALVVLFFGLNFLKGIHLFASNNPYYIAFDDVSGVNRGCPVYAEGVVIGSVSSISYDYTHQSPTALLAAIDKRMVIPEGTTAVIASDLLGNTYITLQLGDTSAPAIPVNGTIMGGSGSDTVAKLKEMVPAVEALLPKFDSIMTSLSLLLADPAIQEILVNTSRLTANLNTSTTQLTQSLSTTTEQLNTLTAELNRTVPGLLSRADTVLTNTETLTARLAAVDIEETMTKVNQTLDEVGATLKGIETTVADADSLVLDLKAHPKRYVHFSIW